MIYTCYEMIGDCRQAKAEGWSYFIAHYVPLIQRVLAHYFLERADDRALLEQVLRALHEPGCELFGEDLPERPFVAALRQRVLGIVDATGAPCERLDLARIAAALESYTLVERQAVWLELMGYDSRTAGRMLRADAKTVESIRVRAAIGHSVKGRPPELPGAADCITSKQILDLIDGRATWRGRQEIERHTLGCWGCLDHLCRMHEAIDLLRAAKPLTDVQAEPLLRSLGFQAAKKSLWKRIAG